MLPSTAAEDWRYSRIDELDLDAYRPAAPGTRLAAPRGAAALLDALTPDVMVTLTDGFSPVITGSHPSVRVVEATVAGEVEAEVEADTGDAFVALNRAYSSPLSVTFARDREGRVPVVAVVHLVSGNGAASFPRVGVRVDSDADGVLVELAVSAHQSDAAAGRGEIDPSNAEAAGPDALSATAGAALSAPVTELDLGPAARLDYVYVQDLGAAVWQLGVQTSRVDRDATLRSTSVGLGGDYARTRSDSQVIGPGAHTKLSAVYFSSGTQMLDFRTLQDHRAPRTTSELLFKGALANESRTVYTGLIRVEKGASGTNAFQTNRNLVLHDGAHAESVPNLEIEENDVRCSHASTVGPVADDQRFYLESRGVPTDVADRLITLGSLSEVIDRMVADQPRLEGVGRWVNTALQASLDRAEAAERARTAGSAQAGSAEARLPDAGSAEAGPAEAGQE